MDKKLLIEAWKRGANSVGWGKKRPNESERIIFGVPTKQNVPKSQDLNLITSEYTGVVQVGKIKALFNTDRMRPAQPGCSIGHEDITAGTFGCVVHRNGVKFILSNNHVLANSNRGEIGDAILQPGPYDGGGPSDKIAELHDFVKIRFMDEDSNCSFSKGVANTGNLAYKLAPNQPKSRFKVIAHTTFADSVFNYVDAAIARPLSVDMINDDVIDIGPIVGTSVAGLGAPIKKSGRTTSLTTGSVIQTDVTVQVQYGAGKIAIFSDQLMAGAMSAGGDSGSAVLDENNRIVGLLFAGSDSTTIINRIDNVFAELNLSL